MSLAADVAITAAERVERSAGASAGLALFRRLAGNAGGADLRGRALLGALRCATALADEAALRELSQQWRSVDAGLWDGIIVACKEAWRAGLRGGALAIAEAEAGRAPAARSVYLVARCYDVLGDPRAAAAFTDALVRAEREGNSGILHASRVRRAAWLARAPATLPEAIAEAQRVALPAATPAERLVLARILLRSPSRFARTSAIALLDALVSAADVLQPPVDGAPGSASPPADGAPGSLASPFADRADAILARRALVVAARHADDVGDQLSALEVDRLLALFARDALGRAGEPARAALRAIDRLARAAEKKSDAELDAALSDAARGDPELAALHARARDILRGRFEPAQLSTALTEEDVTTGVGHRGLWTSLLDTVAALRDQAWPRAAHTLGLFRAVAARGQRMPPQLWTVVESALLTGDAELQSAAARLAEVLFAPAVAAPPRGWLGLSRALALGGRDDLATVARRAAAIAKEPGAVDALALALTRSGWQLAEANDRMQAIERLREARALTTR